MDIIRKIRDIFWYTMISDIFFKKFLLYQSVINTCIEIFHKIINNITVCGIVMCCRTQYVCRWLRRIIHCIDNKTGRLQWCLRSDLINPRRIKNLLGKTWEDKTSTICDASVVYQRICANSFQFPHGSHYNSVLGITLAKGKTISEFRIFHLYFMKVNSV